MAEAGPRGSLWCELGAVSLGAYAEAIAEEGYDEVQELIDADPEHIDWLVIDIKMKKPHVRTFRKWLAGLATPASKEETLAKIAAGGDAEFAVRDAAPEVQADKEVVFAAVAQSGGALKHAAAELRSDREVVLAAVAGDGSALEYASAELRADREVVLAAVAQDGSALAYAAAELKADREIVLATKDFDNTDKQAVLAAVAGDGDALEYTAAELRADREVVLAAVAQDGSALEYAAAELKADREFVLAAVAQSGSALRHASAELRADSEFTLAAVAKNCRALQYAAVEVRVDREVVLAAFATDGCSLEQAAKKLRADREVVLAAVAQDGHALLHAAKKLRADREVVLVAVAQDGHLLHAAKKLQADREVVLAAVAQSGFALMYASAELRADREVVLAALANENQSTYGGHAIKHASAELKADRAVVLAAVAQSGGALEHAAAELQADREIVLACRPGMLILVTTPTRQTFTLEVDGTTTVKNVKAQLQDREGIPVDQQRLIFAANTLKDGRTLASYDIKHQTEIYFASRLRGGGGGKQRWRAVADDAMQAAVETAQIQRSSSFSLSAAEAREQANAAYISCFAPPQIEPDAKPFLLEISAYVLAQASAVIEAAGARGRSEAGSRRRLALAPQAEVWVTLQLPADAFDMDEPTDSFVWDGDSGHAQFEVTCLRGSELRIHACAALIDVNGERKAKLRFELNVVARASVSPPVSPPGELSCELDVPEFEVGPGKRHHFFLCHHQGSGGDQTNLLCLRLQDIGYKVWYDNRQMATDRNLIGMKKGVAESECLLIFLSGRKETDTLPDSNGQYEGTFTRWFCHEEMAAATANRLRFVGVMETEDRRGKPDFAQEKRRALGPPLVNGHAPQNVRLLDELCFIPFRRQQHEVEAMLKEIVRQAAVPMARQEPEAEQAAQDSEPPQPLAVVTRDGSEVPFRLTLSQLQTVSARETAVGLPQGFFTRENWVTDSATTACMAAPSCGVVFTFFNRRHHCRRCGKIYCGACSKGRVVIVDSGSERPHRVCDGCYLSVCGT